MFPLWVAGDGGVGAGGCEAGVEQFVELGGGQTS